MQAEAAHLALLNFRKGNFHAASPALRQEDSLLAKIAKGDDKAFGQLLAQSLPRVQAIAWRIVKSHAEAEDIAQETQMRGDGRSAEVDAAIAELPDRQRLALILVHFEEVSQKAAAQTLGLTVDALESLLARARRGLKEKLKNRHAEMLSEFENLG